ncbi:MAG TPA: threonine synthase [Bacteroidota bacterium]|nr:threonine synthase [Bacteroidota bacterium]
MHLLSTSGKSPAVSFRQAVMAGIAPDGGLYLPAAIPGLDPATIEGFRNLSFQEIGITVARKLLDGEIPDGDLSVIVRNALSFPVPLHCVDDDTAVLELFHGPTLAFKDFGARFMAQVLSYFRGKESQEWTILVATSGDTGSAVAQGFLGAEGIRVVLLYPSGRVSTTQELQLTTIGGNVTALEIDGTFDDCQRLVKSAFADHELSARCRLTSANSINIARLVPQSFYYFEAYARRPDMRRPVVFSVPSGNLGNLTGGILAWKMGLPVARFIAATNVNRAFTDYVETGAFTPRQALPTISNAMDVGNPSNLARIAEIFAGSMEALKAILDSTSVTDDATRETIRRVAGRTGYVLDPHGAVAYAALQRWRAGHASGALGVVLETAHPAKFLDAYDDVLKRSIAVPERLAAVLKKKKRSVKLSSAFKDLQSYLLEEVS